MFKFLNLKLYRKFFILAVMLSAVFVLSSTRHVSANGCCDLCWFNYNSCNNYCYGLPSDPATEDCLYNCAVNYDNCSFACGHGVPICPPI